MTDHGPTWPPHGFQWVEPLPRPTRKPRRRRWWLLSVALVVVVAIVVSGVVYWRSDRDELAHIDATIGTPKDLLISFPLDRKPVAGWRINATDVGLPPEVPMGRLFASTNDKAYFITYKTAKDASSSVGWLYGIDTRSGAPLFAPIEIPGIYSLPISDCYGSGVTTAVCITSDAESNRPAEVWVIDLERGQVTFAGPTDLKTGSSGINGYALFPVGNYLGETRLVAIRDGEGVYGIGANAERTWFVPGGGSIFDPGYLQPSDIPPQALAMQNPSPGDPQAPYRMFSAVDGTDLTPTAPEGTRIRKSLLYNGGFAYSMAEPGKHDGLLFYDTAGHLAARYQDPDHDITPVENSVMPMARLRSSPPKWLVFNAAGRLLQSLPAPDPGARFKVVGTNIFIEQSGTDQRWQRWNLETGAAGPVCQLGLQYDYIGSDGSIVIVDGGLSSKNIQAVDPATCTTVWEITPEETDEFLSLWKVGTGLIQGTEKEITQLVAAP